MMQTCLPHSYSLVSNTRIRTAVFIIIMMTGIISRCVVARTTSTQLKLHSSHFRSSMHSSAFIQSVSRRTIHQKVNPCVAYQYQYQYMTHKHSGKLRPRPRPSLLPGRNSIYSSTRRYLSIDSGESSNVKENESEEDIRIKTNAMKWIQNVVVGLNMCPFAQKTIVQNKLSTSVIRGTNEEEIVTAVLYESILRTDTPGTTIVVAPDLYPDDFPKFFDVVGYAEDLLYGQELDGIIQIAPFHPLFEFAGEEDSIGNLTNRSPYPIFHILREEEVEAAVKKIDGDSSKIWKRNIKFLENMEKTYGRLTTENVMAGHEKVEGIKELLEDTDK